MPGPGLATTKSSMKNRPSRLIFTSILRLTAVLIATLIATTVSFSHASDQNLEAIEQLKTLKRELLIGSTSNDKKLKAGIVDRMILAVDGHYVSGDLRLFLAKHCEKMAQREVQNPKNLNSHVWRYLTDLAKVFERSKETPLSAITVLKSFLEYSSILQPKDPQGFVLEADYSNGKDYLNLDGEKAQAAAPRNFSF